MIKYTKRGKNRVITLNQSIGIEQADELYKALIACYKKANKISIEMNKLETIDLSALQLLYAAKKACLLKGIDFLFDPNDAPCVQEQLLKTCIEI